MLCITNGCFRKWWYPQIIQFNRDFHYKSSILGYHYFWKHPNKPFVFTLRGTTNQWDLSPSFPLLLDGTGTTLPFPTKTASRRKDVQFTDNGVTELGCEFLGRTLGSGDRTDRRPTSLDVRCNKNWGNGECVAFCFFAFW